jgi:hypothetical protein
MRSILFSHGVQAFPTHFAQISLMHVLHKPPMFAGSSRGRTNTVDWQW